MKNDQKRDLTQEVISSYFGHDIMARMALISDLKKMGKDGKKPLKKAQKTLQRWGVDQSLAKKFCQLQNK